jgi:hypothetical protein
MADKIILFPKLMQGYVNKAEFALQEGKMVDAEKIIEQALHLDPSHIKINYLYCLVLLQTERLKEVIKHIDKQRKIGLPQEWEEPFEWIYEVAKQETTQMTIPNAHAPDLEQLQAWREGLLSKSYEVQWKTYEKMTGFENEEVRTIVEEFLLSSEGDLLLKTKFLQRLKQAYESSCQVIVIKGNKQEQIELSTVPYAREDWPEEQIAPMKILQHNLYDDPSLEEMAKELWIYYLEKHYPFFPDMNHSLKWAAALHLYTLKIINEDISESQLNNKLVEIYNLSESEIREQCQYFEQLLLIT